MAEKSPEPFRKPDKIPEPFRARNFLDEVIRGPEIKKTPEVKNNPPEKKNVFEDKGISRSQFRRVLEEAYDPKITMDKGERTNLEKQMPYSKYGANI